jgi:hypothetical protein
MLAGLKNALLVGQSIPLVITWSDGGVTTHSFETEAKVIPAPAGLHFTMSGMGA